MCQRIFIAAKYPLYPPGREASWQDPAFGFNLDMVEPPETMTFLGHDEEEQPEEYVQNMREWQQRSRGLYGAVPEAAYLYSLDGCQCYFRYYSEEKIRKIEARDKNNWRNHLEGCNAYISRVAEFLRETQKQTPLWMLWVWEREEALPGWHEWIVTPSHFLNREFGMPQGRGVLKIVPDGTLGAETHHITHTHTEEHPDPACRIRS